MNISCHKYFECTHGAPRKFYSLCMWAIRTTLDWPPQSSVLVFVETACASNLFPLACSWALQSRLRFKTYVSITEQRRREGWCSRWYFWPHSHSLKLLMPRASWRTRPNTIHKSRTTRDHLHSPQYFACNYGKYHVICCPHRNEKGHRSFNSKSRTAKRRLLNSGFEPTGACSVTFILAVGVLCHIFR